MARDLDLLFISVAIAALIGAAAVLAVSWARAYRHTFGSTIVFAAVGSAFGAGTVGSIAACVVDPWFEALISAPIAFLIAGVLGLPVGLFVGFMAGFLVRRQNKV